MYSSNLLLTHILTSLRACPAMARSYRGRMPRCAQPGCVLIPVAQGSPGHCVQSSAEAYLHGQRELVGGGGSEILDKGCARSLEFTAMIRPAGWSKEGPHGGECAARGMEAIDLGLNLIFCCVSARCPDSAGSEPVTAACT